MAALFAVATPSLAAAEEEWNGFYVGAHGGWGFGAVDWILNQSSWFLDNAGEHVHMSGDGIAGGFQAGHLKQWNNLSLIHI